MLSHQTETESVRKLVCVCVCARMFVCRCYERFIAGEFTTISILRLMKFVLNIFRKVYDHFSNANTNNKFRWWVKETRVKHTHTHTHTETQQQCENMNSPNILQKVLSANSMCVSPYSKIFQTLPWSTNSKLFKCSLVHRRWQMEECNFNTSYINIYAIHIDWFLCLLFVPLFSLSHTECLNSQCHSIMIHERQNQKIYKQWLQFFLFALIYSWC